MYTLSLACYNDKYCSKRCMEKVENVIPLYKLFSMKKTYHQSNKEKNVHSFDAAVTTVTVVSMFTGTPYHRHGRHGCHASVPIKVSLINLPA